MADFLADPENFQLADRLAGFPREHATARKRVSENGLSFNGSSWPICNLLLVLQPHDPASRAWGFGLGVPGTRMNLLLKVLIIQRLTRASELFEELGHRIMNRGLSSYSGPLQDP